MTTKPLIEILEEALDLLIGEELIGEEQALASACLDKFKGGNLEGAAALLNTLSNIIPYAEGKETDDCFRARRIARKGFESFDAGKLRDAAGMLQTAIRLDPDEAYAMLGFFCREKGSVEGEETAYKKAIELSQTDLNISRLGEFYRLQNRFEESEDFLKKSIQENPHRTMCAYSLSQCYVSQGRMDEAESVLRKAVKDNLNHNYIHYDLSHFLYTQGRYEEALSSSQKSAELDPSACIYSMIAICYIKLGNLEEAENAHKKQVEVEPDNCHNHCALGSFYRNNGRYDEAIAAYKKAAEIDNVYYIHWSIGKIYAKTGEFENAVESLQKALNLCDRKDPLGSLNFDLGECYEKLNKFEEAKSAYEAAKKESDVRADGKLKILENKIKN